MGALPPTSPKRQTRTDERTQLTAVSLTSRVAESCAAILFARNTVASFFSFGLDVALLWVLVELFEFAYIPAAAVAFIVAMTLHYALSRAWVFRGSDRGLARGYFYFLINAGIGLVTTLAVFAALIEFTGLFYLVARVISSAIAGVLVFVLNAMFNFKAL